VKTGPAAARLLPLGSCGRQADPQRKIIWILSPNKSFRSTLPRPAATQC